MDRVFSHESLAQVTHFRNLLEQAGVACTIKNDKLLGGLGEPLPGHEGIVGFPAPVGQPGVGNDQSGEPFGASLQILECRTTAGTGFNPPNF